MCVIIVTLSDVYVHVRVPLSVSVRPIKFQRRPISHVMSLFIHPVLSKIDALQLLWNNKSVRYFFLSCTLNLCTVMRVCVCAYLHVCSVGSSGIYRVAGNIGRELNLAVRWSKLYSTNIFACVMVPLPWLGPPPNLNFANISIFPVWSRTTKLNDRQYFWLYGSQEFCFRRGKGK